MRRRKIGTALAFVMVAVVWCAAQIPLEPFAPAISPRQAAQDVAKASELVLTGCLRSSPTLTADGDNLVYTLEALEEPDAPSSGVAIAVPADPTRVTYTLSSKSTVSLSEHVNRRVQLTGKLQAPPPQKAPNQDPAAPTTTPPQQQKPGGAHRTFEASALKMLPGKCPTPAK